MPEAKRAKHYLQLPQLEPVRDMNATDTDIHFVCCEPAIAYGVRDEDGKAAK